MSIMMKKASAVFITATVVLLLMLVPGLFPEDVYAEGEPAPPQNIKLNVTATEAGQIQDIVATWPVVEGATSYTVTLVKQYDGKWNEINVPSWGTPTVNINDGIASVDFMYMLRYGGSSGTSSIKVRSVNDHGSSEKVMSDDKVQLSELAFIWNDTYSRPYTCLTGSSIGDLIDEIIEEDAAGSQEHFKYEAGNLLFREDSYNGSDWTKLFSFGPSQYYYYDSKEDLLADAYYIPGADGSEAVKTSKKLPEYYNQVHPFAESHLCPVLGGLHSMDIEMKEDDHKASFSESGRYHLKCSACGSEVKRTFYTESVESVKLSKNTFAYTGKPIKPVVTIIDDDDEKLVEGKDYTLAYSSNKNVGEGKVTVTLIGAYEGTKDFPFEIIEADMDDVKISKVANCKYTGKAIKPAVTVKLGTVKLKSGTDYTLTYLNNVKMGTASIIIVGKGNLLGTRVVNFRIMKANPLKVKPKTAAVKYSALKKKNQILPVTKVIRFTKKGQGSISYKKVSGNSKITINKKNGKVTVKKGLKKGTYKVKVKVTAKGNATYIKATKNVTVTIKVK